MQYVEKPCQLSFNIFHRFFTINTSKIDGEANVTEQLDERTKCRTVNLSVNVLMRSIEFTVLCDYSYTYANQRNQYFLSFLSKEKNVDGNRD